MTAHIPKPYQRQQGTARTSCPAGKRTPGLARRKTFPARSNFSFRLGIPLRLFQQDFPSADDIDARRQVVVTAILCHFLPVEGIDGAVVVRAALRTVGRYVVDAREVRLHNVGKPAPVRVQPVEGPAAGRNVEGGPFGRRGVECPFVVEMPDFRRSRVAGDDGGESVAIEKGILAERGDAGREFDGGEAAAVLEGAVADGGEGGGKADGGERTTVEGVFVDEGDAAAEADGCQLDAVVEGTVADACHLIGNGDGSQGDALAGKFADGGDVLRKADAQQLPVVSEGVVADDVVLRVVVLIVVHAAADDAGFLQVEQFQIFHFPDEQEVGSVDFSADFQAVDVFSFLQGNPVGQAAACRQGHVGKRIGIGVYEVVAVARERRKAVVSLADGR